MAQGGTLLTIRSSNSNRTLRIEVSGNASISAFLEGHQLAGAVEVWVETGDVAGLAQFFADLGSADKPWKDARTWASLEGDFTLAATCTSLGAVTFKVSMGGLPGAAEEWRLQAGIETEFGQLQRLATEAEGLVYARGAT